MNLAKTKSVSKKTTKVTTTLSLPRKKVSSIIYVLKKLVKQIFGVLTRVMLLLKIILKTQNPHQFQKFL